MICFVSFYFRTSDSEYWPGYEKLSLKEEAGDMDDKISSKSYFSVDEKIIVKEDLIEETIIPNQDISADHVTELEKDVTVDDEIASKIGDGIISKVDVIHDEIIQNEDFVVDHEIQSESDIGPNDEITSKDQEEKELQRVHSESSLEGKKSTGDL